MRRLISGAVALLALLALSTTLLAPAQAVTAERAAGKTITTTGWGPLHLGMTDKKAWKTGMVSHDPMGCSWGYAMTKKYADRGFVVWKDRRPKPFTVQEIVIRGDVDRTKAGAHVGTTLGKLRALYPKLSKLTRGSRLEGQKPQGDEDLWVASMHKGKGTLSFQFAYGKKPKAGAKVEMIIVNRKPAVYWGC